MGKKALLISCFSYWYKKRIEPIRELLLSEGYDVSVLMSDFDHMEKEYVGERYAECTYIHVPSYQSNLSVKRVRSHLAFGRSAAKIIDQTEPDLIYLQLPPNNTAKYCRQYKLDHPDTRLVVDIVDLWPESMPIGSIQKTPPALAWKKWRDDCIEAADYVFTECRLFQRKLKRIIDPSRTSVLYLFKEQSAQEKTMVQSAIREKEKARDSGTVKFAYLGTINNIIDIEVISRVLQSAQEQGYQGELHVIGDGESREKLRAAAERTGCKTYFYGLIFDENEKIRILGECDFALNLMKATSEVGLTTKSIDYLSYGIPLINNIKGDTWKIVEHDGIGVNVRSGSEIDLSALKREQGAMSKKAFRCFEKRFDRKSFVEVLRKKLPY